MKLSHILISMVLLLASCTSDEPSRTLPISNQEPVHEEIEEPAPDPERVNQHELSRFLNSNISPVNSVSRYNSITIDTVCGKDGRPTIYVVNYGEDKGFVLVSAVKTAFPILAFNGTGHYDVHNINPAAKFGLENMVLSVDETLTLPADSTKINIDIWKCFEVCRISKSRYSVYDDDYDTWSDDVKENYQQSVLVIRDYVSNWSQDIYAYLDGGLSEYILGGVNEEEVYYTAEGNCYPQFISHYMQLSAVRQRIHVITDYQVDNCLNTNWDQEYGFNQSYPLLSNGNHSYAGCIPVAIGQIMKYYNWPSNFNWDDMPNNSATKTTSDFLYQLAEAGDATYDADGPTTVTAPKASNIFKKYGYNSSGVKDLNSIKQLSNVGKQPFLILGEAYDSSQKKNIGHAFIACGYNELSYEKFLELYTIVQPKIFQLLSSWSIDNFYSANVYINWGWGGRYNGFYNLNYLNPNGHNYNRNLKYILATPNK